MFKAPVFTSTALALCLGTAAPQDSVSKTGCLPGDATDPWQDASDPLGSEQGDSYVVDMATFVSSWGNFFGAAPILKSSRTDAAFFNSLMNSQGMSRTQALGEPFSSSSYSVWAGPGFGINNDPSIHDAGMTLDTSGQRGHRFAAALSEISTAGAASYNGIVSALVDIDPTNPTRLHVTRQVAAINGCDDFSDMGQFGFGSIDENGDLVFRSDDFGVTGTTTCAGLSPVIGNNLFRVQSALRDTSVRNVMSFETGADLGDTDAPATDLLLGAYGDSLNCPGIVPASVTGGKSLYIGTDFGSNYVRGQDIASIKVDQGHFSGQAEDHRGNMMWTSYTFPFLGGEAGTCGLLVKDENDFTYGMNLWSIDADGNVVGRKELDLPSTISDPTTGFAGSAGNEFTHYFSQVAFRGGNGHVAMGRDQAGRMIIAGPVDHPGPAGATNPAQYIAVCRMDPNTGAEEWSIAAHNDGVGGGKPILNGPGGATIGHLSDAGALSGDALPGMSAPMLDGAGNIYFVAIIDTSASGGGLGVGLLRAVYDPANFSYELELLLQSGTVLSGPNSGLNYRISFIELNDTNSIDSAAPWGQNISEKAHLSMCPQGLSTSDPRTLGGLMFACEIVYDHNSDGQFIQCTGAFGDPASPDQDYQVVMYVGAQDPLSDLDANGIADEAEQLSADGVSLSVASGGTQTLNLSAGIENAGKTYAFIGTVSGTSPGFPFGGLTIPANPDGYFFFLLNKGFIGATPFGASFSGLLDASGKATATWTVPADASLVGLTAHHAYGVFDPLPVLEDVSNPWPLAILP